MIDLSKNILSTIIFYDILNFPLTSFDVWKYLLATDRCTLGEVIEALENAELKEHIEEYRGFYFLRGRKHLVAQRIQGEKNSIVKFEIAERMAGWLKYVPFVRMAAVTGTLAMKNCDKGSDIDFFVVLEKGRIFTGRLLVTAVAHFCGQRRHGNKIKNRICLNYFITTGNLEVQRKDVFAANEYSFIFPVFGFEVFQKFCESNLGWLRGMKPNWEVPDLEPARYLARPNRTSRSLQGSGERLINLLFGDRIESWLKRKQIARIRRNPLTRNEGAYIEATDENLIFLPDPQGVRVQDEWQKRVNS